MSDPKDPNPAELLRTARGANEQGNHYLTLGASIGAMGLAGAALGAVCPLCVVATPAFLGLGAVQKLRGLFLAKRAKNPAEGERLTEAVAADEAAAQTPLKP